MSVNKRKDGRYVVYFRDDSGKQRTKYFGSGASAKKEAEIFNAEIRLHKKQGKPVVFSNDIYLDQLTQYYLADCKSRGVKIKYRRETASLFNNYLVPLLGNVPVARLTHRDIINAVNQKWGNVTQTTRNRYMDILKAVFSYGVNDDLIDKNPLSRWKKQKERPSELHLNHNDLVKIKNHAAEHLKWAIDVAWNLGCRPGESELTSLMWSDVKFDRSEFGEVHIRGTKTAGSIRTVPVNEVFSAQLKEMRSQAKTEYVIEYKGRKMKKFRRSFRTACKSAGINYDVRMYDIRHLFATNLISGGADIASVSSMMGHSSNKMTLEQYYHLVSGEKQKTVNCLKPLVYTGDSVGKEEKSVDSSGCPSICP